MSDWSLSVRDWLLGRLKYPDQTPGEGIETTFEHTWPGPPWLTLLGLLLLLAVVAAIYLREPTASRWRLAVLLALRLALLGLAVFMLYGWVRHRHRTELPDLIVAIDVSESMSVTDDYEDVDVRQAVQQLASSTSRGPPSRIQLAAALLTDEQRGWLTPLQERYRVKLFRLGASAQRIEVGSQGPGTAEVRGLRGVDPTSRLGDGLLEILRSQRGHSTAAAIVLTDGNTTDGASLSEAAGYAREKSIPLFLVGLGSEQPPRDVRLSDLLAEEIAFLGDVLSFDFKLHSQGFTGRQATVRLRRTDSADVLAEEVIDLPEDQVALPIHLSHRPTEEGTFEYAVEVEPRTEETNHSNNRLTRTVSVRNATIRVLLVQASPSYEYRFLKNLLARAIQHGDGVQRAVELTAVLQESDLAHTDDTLAHSPPLQREALFAYDVLVLGDCNPAYFSRSVMENISDFVTERGGGVIFLAGPNFMPLQFQNTPLTPLLPFNLATAAVPEAEELAGAGFSVQPTALGLESPLLQLGDSPEESPAVWKQLPRVRWLLEISDVNTHALILAEHSTRRNLSGRKLPVLLLQFVGAGKVAFLATDETYRWSRPVEHEKYYARFWMQMLRYLSRSKLLSDEVPATLMTDSAKYQHGETVRVRVQLRDERLAPAANEGVTVTLEDEQGKRRPVVLTRLGDNRGLFEAVLSELAVGAYRVTLATPTLKQAPPPHRFAVESPRGELSRLAMNAADMHAAAEASDGRFYSLRYANRLPHGLPSGDQVRIEPLPAEPVWNSSWVAALFVLLVTTEWLLRRGSGLL